MKDSEWPFVYADPPEKQRPAWWLGVSILCVIIVMVWGIVEAIAQPIIRVNVVRGVAPISVTKAEARYIFKEATAQIERELGVKIVARKWKAIRQRNYYFYEEFPLTIYERIRLDAQRGFYAVKNPTVFISAPAMLNGAPIIFGATDGYACKNMNWIHTGAAVTGVNNESIIALAHEMLHMLGANHTYEQKDSIMDENVLSLGDVRVTETSKAEVNRCLGRL